MGDGKWETNGVKVNHPTPRLGYDAFESRSTLADPRSARLHSEAVTNSIWSVPLQTRRADLRSTAAQRTQNRSIDMFYVCRATKTYIYIIMG